MHHFSCKMFPFLMRSSEHWSCLPFSLLAVHVSFGHVSMHSTSAYLGILAYIPEYTPLSLRVFVLWEACDATVSGVSNASTKKVSKAKANQWAYYDFATSCLQMASKEVSILWFCHELLANGIQGGHKIKLFVRNVVKTPEFQDPSSIVPSK